MSSVSLPPPTPNHSPPSSHSQKSTTTTSPSSSPSHSSLPSPLPLPLSPLSPPLPPLSSPPSLFSQWNSRLPVPLSAFTLVHLSSGALARFSGACLTSPIDTIKVRLQFQQKHFDPKKKIKHFDNSFHAAKTIFTEEGIMAFYKGLPARLLYITPAAAISFVFYEEFRAIYHDHISHNKEERKHSLVAVTIPLLLGGIARVVGTFARTPFDVVKQRMQIQNSLPKLSVEQRKAKILPDGYYKHTLDAFIGVFTREGFKGFWSGFGATILRDVPFSAVYFMSYEGGKTLQKRFMDKTSEIKHHIASSPSSSSPPISSSSSPRSINDRVTREIDKDLKSRNFLLAGAMAAACAVTATQPMDVIKTRLQTQGSLSVGSTSIYKGVWHCATVIWKEDGVKGFYRGWGPRLVHLCPSAAITFTLYETFKRKISQHFVEELEQMKLNGY